MLLPLRLSPRPPTRRTSNGSAASPARWLEDYRQWVQAGGVHVLENAGRVQGFIILLDDGNALLLDNLAIAPDAQGLGFGRLLMDFAEHQALDAGFMAIRLYTNEAMTE